MLWLPAHPSISEAECRLFDGSISSSRSARATSPCFRLHAGEKARHASAECDGLRGFSWQESLELLLLPMGKATIS